MKLKQDQIIKFRATVHDKARVDEIAQKTGLSMSEVLRQLITNAEVQPVSTFRPFARLTNSNTSGDVLPDAAGIAR